MSSMLAAGARENVVPAQALAHSPVPRPQHADLPRWQDAQGRWPFYSSIMRPDMPFALGGVVVGLVLLGDAAIAADAAPLRAIDVALVVVMVAAVAVGRRYPAVALAVVTATMLAFHLRVHAGVSAAF